MVDAYDVCTRLILNRAILVPSPVCIRDTMDLTPHPYSVVDYSRAFYRVLCKGLPYPATMPTPQFNLSLAFHS